MGHRFGLGPVTRDPLCLLVVELCMQCVSFNRKHININSAVFVGTRDDQRVAYIVIRGCINPSSSLDYLAGLGLAARLVVVGRAETLLLIFVMVLNILS